jgi:hypothetical protein
MLIMVTKKIPGPLKFQTGIKFGTEVLLMTITRQKLTVMERFIGVIYTLLLMDMSLIPLKK